MKNSTIVTIAALSVLAVMIGSYLVHDDGDSVRTELCIGDFYTYEITTETIEDGQPSVETYLIETRIVGQTDGKYDVTITTDDFTATSKRTAEQFLNGLMYTDREGTPDEADDVGITDGEMTFHKAGRVDLMTEFGNVRCTKYITTDTIILEPGDTPIVLEMMIEYFIGDNNVLYLRHQSFSPSELTPETEGYCLYATTTLKDTSLFE